MAGATPVRSGAPQVAQAWTVWMREEKEPEDKSREEAPIGALSALAERLQISGTHTTYFEPGRGISHGLSAAGLEGPAQGKRRSPRGQANAARRRPLNVKREARLK